MQRLTEPNSGPPGPSRLTREALELLAEAAIAPELLADPKNRKVRLELVEAGLADDTSLSATAQAIGETVGQPAMRIEVDELSPEMAKAELAIGQAWAVLSAELDHSGSIEVGLIPASGYAAAIARLVGLSPRPDVSGENAIVVAAGDLDRFYESGQKDGRLNAAWAVDAEAAERLSDPAEVLAEIVRTPTIRWRANATWVTPSGDSAGRTCEVIDAAERGLWLVDRLTGIAAREELLLVGATPRLVWGRLVGLVPDDADLAGH